MIAACRRDQHAGRFSVQQRSAHEKRIVCKRDGVHEREQCARERTAPENKTARKGNDLRSRKACGSNEQGTNVQFGCSGVHEKCYWSVVCNAICGGYCHR